MKKEKVYEVIGRNSGGNLNMKTKFVHATSKENAKAESMFDYVKSIYIRKDIDPSTVKNPFEGDE